LRFVHHQVDDSSMETLAAKLAIEKFAAKHGVRISHYHCDNGRFANNAFKESCKNGHQRLTFCRVNAHFQKWDCGARNLGYLGERAKAIAPRSRSLASYRALCPMAVRRSQRRSPPQQSAGVGG
jgi:hypothetical protein